MSKWRGWIPEFEYAHQNEGRGKSGHFRGRDRYFYPQNIFFIKIPKNYQTDQKNGPSPNMPTKIRPGPNPATLGAGTGIFTTKKIYSEKFQIIYQINRKNTESSNFNIKIFNKFKFNN